MGCGPARRHLRTEVARRWRGAVPSLLSALLSLGFGYLPAPFLRERPPHAPEQHLGAPWNDAAGRGSDTDAPSPGPSSRPHAHSAGAASLHAGVGLRGRETRRDASEDAGREGAATGR